MPSLNILLFRFWIGLTKHIILMVDATLDHLRREENPAPGYREEPLRHQPLRLTIPVLHGALEARFLCPAQPDAAILLFHGIGERLCFWQDVQVLLARHGCASLVFHYSGYGFSTGTLSPDALRADAQSAYIALAAMLPPQTPVFLLGFSMGTGVATDVAAHLDPAPAGLILCQGFQSLRAAAASIARSTLLARLMPDVWRTVDTVASLRIPLLIVHSHADELFPAVHARNVYEAARRGSAAVRYVTPRGFTHKAVYQNPTLAYWQPILDFVRHHTHRNPRTQQRSQEPSSDTLAER